MGRRVCAPRRNLPAAVGAQALRDRETGAGGGRPSSTAHAIETLRRARLQQSFDAMARPGAGEPRQPPLHLRRRSRVRELLASAVSVEGGVRRLVLLLTQSGVCSVHDRDTGRRICWMNVEADETICSLYLSASDESIVTVSLFSDDVQQALRCRTTPLARLAAGKPHAWRPLFERELFKFPGFVEFADHNGICLTFCAATRAYRVWDLAAPGAPLFEIPASAGIKEVKVTRDLALVIQRSNHLGVLPLALLSLADGALVHSWQLALEGAAERAAEGAAAAQPGGRRGGGGRAAPSPVSPLELLEPHLLVKQAGLPLRIHDVLSGVCVVREVSAAHFGCPHTLIYCDLNDTLLAFSDADTALWDFHGRRLARLWGPGLIPPGAGGDGGANTVFLSRSSALLLAYWDGTGGRVGEGQAAGEAEAAAAGGGAGEQEQGGQPEADAPRQQQGSAQRRLEPGGPTPASGTSGGCVVVWDAVRGQQVARIAASTGPDGKPDGRAQAALQGVTSLFYDEAAEEVYVGTADGRAHVFAA
eukprot:scaffold3.g6456.t1